MTGEQVAVLLDAYLQALRHGDREAAAGLADDVRRVAAGLPRTPPYEVPAPAIQVWPPTTTEREEQE